ncbi:unnamed protein product, partial [Polarella glacialis]
VEMEHANNPAGNGAAKRSAPPVGEENVGWDQEAKRPRTAAPQLPLAGGASPPQQGPRDGHQGGKETTMLVPAQSAGAIIGKQGSGLKLIRERCGVHLEVLQQDKAPQWPNERVVILKGSLSGRQAAVAAVVHAAFPLEQHDAVDLRLLVSSSDAGAVIGRQGGNLKAIRERCQVGVQVDKNEIRPGERLVTANGALPAVLAASHLILESLVWKQVGNEVALCMQMPLVSGDVVASYMAGGALWVPGSEDNLVVLRGPEPLWAGTSLAGLLLLAFLLGVALRLCVRCGYGLFLCCSRSLHGSGCSLLLSGSSPGGGASLAFKRGDSASLRQAEGSRPSQARLNRGGLPRLQLRHPRGLCGRWRKARASAMADPSAAELNTLNNLVSIYDSAGFDGELLSALASALGVPTKIRDVVFVNRFTCDLTVGALTLLGAAATDPRVPVPPVQQGRVEVVRLVCLLRCGMPVDTPGAPSTASASGAGEAASGSGAQPGAMDPGSRGSPHGVLLCSRQPFHSLSLQSGHGFTLRPSGVCFAAFAGLLGSLWPARCLARQPSRGFALQPSAVSQLDFAAWSRFYLAAITVGLGSLRGCAWQPLARSVSCEAALTGLCFAAVSRFAACLCSLVTALPCGHQGFALQPSRVCLAAFGPLGVSPGSLQGFALQPSAVSQLVCAVWSRFYLAAITVLLGSLRGCAWQPLARSVSCEAALTGFCFAAVSRFAAGLCSLVTALPCGHQGFALQPSRVCLAAFGPLGVLRGSPHGVLLCSRQPFHSLTLQPGHGFTLRPSRFCWQPSRVCVAAFGPLGVLRGSLTGFCFAAVSRFAACLCSLVTALPCGHQGFALQPSRVCLAAFGPLGVLRGSPHGVLLCSRQPFHSLTLTAWSRFYLAAITVCLAAFAVVLGSLWPARCLARQPSRGFALQPSAVSQLVFEVWSRLYLAAIRVLLCSLRTFAWQPLARSVSCEAALSGFCFAAISRFTACSPHGGLLCSRQPFRSVSLQSGHGFTLRPSGFCFAAFAGLLGSLWPARCLARQPSRFLLCSRQPFHSLTSAAWSRFYLAAITVLLGSLRGCAWQPLARSVSCEAALTGFCFVAVSRFAACLCSLVTALPCSRQGFALQPSPVCLAAFGRSVSCEAALTGVCFAAAAVSQRDVAVWSRFYLAVITVLLGSLRGFAWQPLARSVSCEAALTGFCFAAVSRFAACLCSLVTALPCGHQGFALQPSRLCLAAFGLLGILRGSPHGVLLCSRQPFHSLTLQPGHGFTLRPSRFCFAAFAGLLGSLWPARCLARQPSRGFALQPSAVSQLDFAAWSRFYLATIMVLLGSLRGCAWQPLARSVSCEAALTGFCLQPSAVSQLVFAVWQPSRGFALQPSAVSQLDFAAWSRFTLRPSRFCLAAFAVVLGSLWPARCLARQPSRGFALQPSDVSQLVFAVWSRLYLAAIRVLLCSLRGFAWQPLARSVSCEAALTGCFVLQPSAVSQRVFAVWFPLGLAVRVKSDSRGALGAILKLCSPSPLLNTVVREIALDLSSGSYDISVLEHTPGVTNFFPDALSRQPPCPDPKPFPVELATANRTLIPARTSDLWRAGSFRALLGDALDFGVNSDYKHTRLLPSPGAQGLSLPPSAAASCLPPPGLERLSLSAGDWRMMCEKDAVLPLPLRRRSQSEVPTSSTKAPNSSTTASSCVGRRACLREDTDSDGEDEGPETGCLESPKASDHLSAALAVEELHKAKEYGGANRPPAVFFALASANGLVVSKAIEGQEPKVVARSSGQLELGVPVLCIIEMLPPVGPSSGYFGPVRPPQLRLSLGEGGSEILLFLPEEYDPEALVWPVTRGGDAEFFDIDLKDQAWARNQIYASDLVPSGVDAAEADRAPRSSEGQSDPAAPQAPQAAEESSSGSGCRQQ